MNKGKTDAGITGILQVLNSDWDTSLPIEAGTHMFHWNGESNSELQGYYNASSADTELGKEKEAVYKYAIAHWKVSGLTKEKGWLKMVRNTSGKKWETLYIVP